MSDPQANDRRPTVSLATLMAWVALVALVLGLVTRGRDSAGDPRRWMAMQTSQLALEQPLTTPIANGTAFEDVVRAAKKASVRPGLPTGLMIYIDPVGMMESGKTLFSPVTFVTTPRTAGEALAGACASLGLAASIRWEPGSDYALVAITDRKSQNLRPGDVRIGR